MPEERTTRIYIDPYILLCGVCSGYWVQVFESTSPLPLEATIEHVMSVISPNLQYNQGVSQSQLPAVSDQELDEERLDLVQDTVLAV